MNPIEQLIQAGHTPVLDAAGHPFGKASWVGGQPVCELRPGDIERAGIAAMEWLAKRREIFARPRYLERTREYAVDTFSPEKSFYAPTLAEAAILAAIAVWEQEKKP